MDRRILIILIIIYSGCLYSLPKHQLFDQKLILNEIKGSSVQFFSFNLTGYKLGKKIVEGNEYTCITCKNEGGILALGKPDLPKISRFISIPDRSDVVVRILDYNSEIIKNIEIYPCQKLQNEKEKTEKEFIIDNDFYDNGDLYPKEIIQLSDPMIMRNERIVIISINPFQYNPCTKTLEIFQNIEIEIKFEGINQRNQKVSNKKLSRYFNNSYSSTIVNYDSKSRSINDFQQFAYLLIYPDDPQVEEILQEFILWKRQKGFDVTAVSTAETGNDLYSIKEYIQIAYDTWENPPEFICLAGDPSGCFIMPTGYLEGGEGDQAYVLLEGDDILADAFIGRFSFNSIFELQTMIAKSIMYEKNPYLGQTDWFNNILLIGDPNDSGISCVNTKISIKEMIQGNANNYEFSEIYSGPWETQISENINLGASILNYRGFYGMSGFDLIDINNLTNGAMTPFVVILTCGVGDFDGTSDCRTERFLKVGSPTAPRGAVAAIGTATVDTNTCFNNTIDTGIFQGIFAENIFHPGGALNRGKLNIIMNYPDNPYNAIYKFSYWNNLMGDPSLDLWTSIPEHLVITSEDLIFTGSNYYQLNVSTTGGFPLADAVVTLCSDQNLINFNCTDQDGNALMELPETLPEELKLTVTKHNYLPSIKTITTVEGEILLSISDITIDDDNEGSSIGNSDNLINPGELIELTICLENHGLFNSGEVSALLTSESKAVTILDSIETWGVIFSDSLAISNDDFDLLIENNLEENTQIEFELLIYDSNGIFWNDHFNLNISSFKLDISNSYFQPEGNPEPGEETGMIIEIRNEGSISAFDVYCSLSANGNEVEIIDSVTFLGDLLPNTTWNNSDDPFLVQINEMIIPGTEIVLTLDFYNTIGLIKTEEIFVSVGEVQQTDPIGPDSYGYYCYDSGDTEYEQSPEYNWYEIDPNYGGFGMALPFSDNGDEGAISIVDIPFNFRFYGSDYTTLTICSNGWLCPGSTELMSFMNWSIPDPSGPSPIIAPFWDDLITPGGSVCYYYSEDLGCFIVEWSRLQNQFNGDQETFQVLLMDPEDHPTITGDNQIVFQYHTVNNVDQGNYGPYSNHGQFATVGIEDPTGMIGLLYTYNNQYPVAAAELGNSTSLLFSTPEVPTDLPSLILDHFVLTDPPSG